MKLPRSSYWLLVALAVAMVLGHICALPFHAHAGTITTHEHDAHHDDGKPSNESEHSGSCDALKTTAAAHGAPVVVALGPVSSVVVRSTRQVPSAEAVLFGSPPLFLLHNVLLI